MAFAALAVMRMFGIDPEEVVRRAMGVRKETRSYNVVSILKMARV